MTNGLSKMTKTGLDKLKCFGQNYWPCQCLQCPKWPCYLVKALINGHMHKCLLINWKLAKRSQRRVFMTSYKSMSSSSWLPCILKGSFRHFLGTFGVCKTLMQDCTRLWKIDKARLTKVSLPADAILWICWSTRRMLLEHVSTFHYAILATPIVEPMPILTLSHERAVNNPCFSEHWMM